MVDISKQHSSAGGKPRDWSRAMSDHVAYALLVYTGLTIFVTVKAMEEGTSSILPYVALVALVAAIIPACRWFEKRWASLEQDEATSRTAPAGFRRDTVALWIMALALPLVLTAMFKAALAIT